MKSRIIHFEIPADDPERAKRFYGSLFGWEFAATPGFDNYWTFRAGDAEEDSGGGLMSRMSPDQVGLVSYFNVASVADASAQVEKLGGKVVMAKSPVPGMGWFAQCVDPEGNLFALWETDEAAA